MASPPAGAYPKGIYSQLLYIIKNMKYYKKYRVRAFKLLPNK